MSGQPRDGQQATARVDAAVDNTAALLELVRREEEVLASLRRCGLELAAIRRARLTLVDRADAGMREGGGQAGSACAPDQWGRGDR